MQTYRQILSAFLVAISIIMSNAQTINQNKKITIDTITSIRPKLIRMTASSNGQPEIKHPQMALINRYGDYPVDLANGLVNISIPIYEIKDKDLSLPVSISFHASGLKADELESSLGLRWVLNTGGMVSRKIKCYPDEKFPFLQNIDQNYTPDFVALYGTTWSEQSSSTYDAFNGNLFYLKDVMPNADKTNGEYRDSQYDIFSYSLPTGKSGKFILKDSAGIKKPCLMPNEPLKISLFKDRWSKYGKIEIVDESGITYRYGGLNASEGSSGQEADNDANTVGWYLTRIISVDKKDSIQLEYNVYPNDLVPLIWYDNVNINDNLHENTDPYIPQDNLFDYLSETFGEHEPWVDFNSNIMHIPCLYVSKIKFNQGTLNFEYTNGRINTITIKENNSNTVIQKFKIDISKGLNNKMNLLKSLTKFSVKNGVEKQEETHRFEYYDDPSIPDYDNLSKFADWWGYYTSKGGRKIFTEEVSISSPLIFGKKSAEIGGTTDRSSIADDMKLGMIKCIQYPTGGKTEFEYEANRYKNAYKVSDCGGIRVKRIINTSDNGRSEIRSFTYGTEGCGIIPEYLYHNGLLNKYNESETEVVMYESRVDEYGNILVAPYPTDYAAYTTRTFSGDFPSNYFDFHSNIVYYDKVTEYIGGDTFPQKIEYEYGTNLLEHSNYEFNNYYYSPMNVYISPLDFWKNGHLLIKRIYKNIGGNYSLVKRVDYGYTTYNKDEVYDLPVFQYRNQIVMPDPGSIPSQGMTMEEQKIARLYEKMSQSFGYKLQKYTIGADKLEIEEESSYSDNGVLISSKETKYEPKYLLPNEETVMNSNGRKFTTKYTYPFNYSQSVYKDMSDRHILSPVIETSVYSNDGTLLKKEKNNYSCVYPNEYLPISLERQYKNASSEVRDQYSYYSNGNIRDVVKDGFEKIVYLWGYNGQYPVAKIEGVSYEEVKNALTESYINSLSTNYSVTQSDGAYIRSKLSSLKALVTTFTYKPLIGITSMSSPSGSVTTYEYDSLGRLVKSFDPNGKIMGQYDYHYKP
ncbi:RHS repeat domain-containing protein [uncultured Bacteroides sp.]|uniref:RHS repeat protein n=1 Tax=uncultured Bacteroides sp. TaxID=162156 RepID=UPI002AAAFAC8|nr:RHS repeat domain-containing protein [uncultured Bacteroides sp.]